MWNGIHIGIPRPGHRIAAGGEVVVPQSLLGFDANNSARSAGFYTAAADIGSGGGSWAAVNSPRDTAHFADLKHIPHMQGTSRFTHSAAASTWNFLHNTTGVATVIARFYTRVITSGGVLFSTCQGGAGQPGFVLTVNAGVLSVSIGKSSSAAQFVCASASALTTGWHTVVVRKNATTVSMSVDGEPFVSGVITSPSAASAQTAASLGGTTFGSAANSITSYVADLRVWDAALTPLQENTHRARLLSAWSSVPGVITYLDADNGVTLASGFVSAWADRAIGNGLSDAGSTARRPSIVSPWRNGQNALRFDGSDVLSRATLLHGMLAQPSAIYHVGEYPNPGAAGERISSHIGASRSDEFTGAGVVNLTMYSGSSLAAAISPAAPGLAFASFAHYGGASSVIGTYISNGNFHSNSGNAGTSGRDGLAVGAFSLSSNFWTGAIALVMLVDHIPSAAGHNEIITANRTRYTI